MFPALKLDVIDDLSRAPASDVKKLGWRGIMKTVGRNGRLAITNHNEPEAVILSADDYDAIMRALQAAQSRPDPALEALRSRFDERLQSLAADDAGDRLRALMRKPATLGGKVKAGTGF